MPAANRSRTSGKFPASGPLVESPAHPGRKWRRTLVAVDERRISVDPLKMQGWPRIRDTRITVCAVLGQLAAGRSVDQVLYDYPDLEPEDVQAALAFAVERLRP